MNAVLGWIKSNVLIVVFAVVILALPPLGVVGSMMWNASIREGVEEEFKRLEGQLRGARELNYVIPPIDKGEEAVEIRTPANAAVTAFVVRQRDARQAEIESVVGAAVERNKGAERSVLVEGVFPEPPEGQQGRELLRRVAERVSGTGGRSSAYASLFARINAGGPPDPVSVARVVVESQERELDRLGESITDEDRERLDQMLRSQRLAAYAARAEEISVYGDWRSVLGSAVDPASHSVPPLDGPPASTSAAEAFAWQFDYWIVEDLAEAIRKANTDASGLLTETPRSVVKRIESITIEKMDLPEPEGSELDGAFPLGPGGIAGGGFDGRDGRGGRGGRPDFRGRDEFGGRGGRGDPRGEFGGFEEPAGPSTHTGRASGVDNDIFDVRMATLTVVASSARLGELIDAIGGTNFMTVVGMRLSEVDVWADLAQGYFYGDEHVVRAELDIETVWLRFWTAEAMPQAVRETLGVELPAVEDEAVEGMETP